MVWMRYYLRMTSDLNIWLERLSSLHRKHMRAAANAEGIQLVHLEILRFLAISNKYSNTAQALCDYLGQTKGSISQSLKLIEDAGHIERRPCEKDGRVIRLYLSAEGQKCLKRLEKIVLPELPDNEKRVSVLKDLLTEWQVQNGLKGFGQCKSCRFNEQLSQNKFKCGLTGEALSKTDRDKICQEHVF